MRRLLLGPLLSILAVLALSLCSSSVAAGHTVTTRPAGDYDGALLLSGTTSLDLTASSEIAHHLPFTATLTSPGAAAATGFAAEGGVGFAEGLGQSALTPGRLQHGTKNLTNAGVLPAWSGKTSPGIIERALVSILERPAATFDHTLGGTRVRGFLGDIDGQQVAVFVYKEGPYQGQLASSFVPSPNQLKMWGLG